MSDLYGGPKWARDLVAKLDAAQEAMTPERRRDLLALCDDEMPGHGWANIVRELIEVIDKVLER
jgi:hypothetical protein